MSYTDSGFDNNLIRVGFSGAEDTTVDSVNSGELIEAGGLPISDVVGALVQTGTLDADGNLIGDIINANLDTEAREILANFTFGASGAIKVITDENNGLWISPTGILAKKAGVNKFTIGADGDCVYAGTLSVANLLAGTISSKQIVLGITAGTGDCAIRSGKTDFTNTETGFILGVDDSDSDKPKFYIGSSTKYLNWDGTSLTIRGTLNADDITAGTLSGITVQSTSSTTGAKVRLAAGSSLDFLYNNSVMAYVYASDGRMMIDADNSLYIGADNEVMIYYNDDGGSDSCAWAEDGGFAMAIDDAKDLTVADDIYADNYYDYAEFFEAIPKHKDGIPVGTTVCLVGDLVRPAEPGEQPFGVVSGSAAIILNAGSTDAGRSWGKKYLTDDYGQKIYEEVEKWYLPKELNLPREQRKGLVRDGNVPRGATIKKRMIQKLNPDWDESKKFIPRKKRPEWHKIGLIGRVRITKGQPVNSNWIKLKEISPTVEEWLIK